MDVVNAPSDIPSSAMASVHTKPQFVSSLLAGGSAGLVVDLTMFPLDTLKTRLQSQNGFWSSGGFRNVYRGIAPAAAASVPCASLFFCTYDTMKHFLGARVQKEMMPLVHVLSASMGEVTALSIRVPLEIAKQRLQATATKRSAIQLVLDIWQKEGFRGCYRGLGSTILREVPFSCLQFPLWELFKSKWQQKTGRQTTPIEGALCGSISGGLAASITTPLDVAKTRIMLFNKTSPNDISQKVPNVAQMLGIIYRKQGINGLFSGLVPRVCWITIGGVVFFGVYEHSMSFLNEITHNR